jgi:outer membrane receptor for ferrienterochelin and colicin
MPSTPPGRTASDIAEEIEAKINQKTDAASAMSGVRPHQHNRWGESHSVVSGLQDLIDAEVTVKIGVAPAAHRRAPRLRLTR